MQAIKLIQSSGVKGEKIWGDDQDTQDWTFNNYPILELRTPQVTYEIADSLEVCSAGLSPRPEAEAILSGTGTISQGLLKSSRRDRTQTLPAGAEVYPTNIVRSQPLLLLPID